MTGGFLHANLEQKEDGSLGWRFFPAGMIETVELGRAQDAMAEFSRIEAPTLLIRGSLSREFPQDEAEKMQRSRNNVRLVVLEGAGHFVHAEKPGEFTKALLDFLDHSSPLEAER